MNLSINLSTGDYVEDKGAKALSEALKSNTTLTELNLGGGDKRKKTHKRRPSTIHSFPFLFTSTDNNIGETETTSLSESLKSNTTLTELYLWGDDKRKKTHKRHQSTFTLFLSLHVNRQQDWSHRSIIIE